VTESTGMDKIRNIGLFLARGSQAKWNRKSAGREKAVLNRNL
jgi:hypothetical protein